MSANRVNSIAWVPLMAHDRQVTTPQNPRDESAQPTPSTSPTTIHQIPTPPGSAKQRPAQPPAASPPPPERGAHRSTPAPPVPDDAMPTTQYVRQPPAGPTDAPTRVHSRPQMPPQMPPQAPAGPAAGPGPTQYIPARNTPTQQPPYQQPPQDAPERPGPAPYQRQPVADGLSMKHRNPFAVWLGLPIITFGIYELVWYCKIHQEMAAFDRRKGIPIAGPDAGAPLSRLDAHRSHSDV